MKNHWLDKKKKRNKPMGIGALGLLGNLTFGHRKWRRTFEGFDIDGNVVCPAWFCKQSVRTDNSMNLTCYDEETVNRINEIAPSITSGVFRLYDGFGTLLESWELKGVKMTIIEAKKGDATWHVAYDSHVFTSHVFADPIPMPDWSASMRPFDFTGKS